MLDAPGFLDRLSSADPVPGGGSVAALQAAMAASLLVMVANLTLGRAKLSHVHAEAEGFRTEAVRLRDRAVELAEEDVAAYEGVSRVLALPRGTDAERDERRRRMQEALKAASVPPAETMRVAARILEVAAEMVRIGNPSAVSDVGTAALAARAAFHAARLNVEINMAGVRDPSWVSSMRAQLSDFEGIDQLEQRTLQATERSIRGEDA